MSIAIHLAKPADMPHVMAGLQGLAADLGDPFNASAAQVEAALFGANPMVRAQLALQGDNVLGLAYYSPMFSTMLGAGGCYVSDLWAAQAARGQGLGARLLAAVARDSGAVWQAKFIKLAAYVDNAPALAFYEKLGFEHLSGETALRLNESAMRALGETL